MLVLDRDKAAPLIFASMPRSDRNIQYHTFKLHIRLIQNGEKVKCLKDMHDAAARCLEADTNADAGEQALFAIGLTGDKSDFPLLKKLYRNSHQTPVWQAKLRNAAEAALAKLGSKEHITNIRKELRQPIPEPFTREDAISLVAAIEKAGFTRNRDFVPLLRSHLKTPEPKPRTDSIVSPAYSAGLALDAIFGKDWREKKSRAKQTAVEDNRLRLSKGKAPSGEDVIVLTSMAGDQESTTFYDKKSFTQYLAKLPKKSKIIYVTGDIIFPDTLIFKIGSITLTQDQLKLLCEKNGLSYIHYAMW